MSNDRNHTAPPGMLSLQWQPESGSWYAKADPWAETVDDAVGPAGPAGVVLLAEGDLRISQCFITGRVEQLWIPAERDPAQAALLDLMLDGAVPDLDTPDTGDQQRAVTVRGVTARGEAFRWSRLVEDQFSRDGPDEAQTRTYLLVELAVTAIALHELAPRWLNDGQVAERLEAAVRASRGEHALRLDVVDPDLQTRVERALKEMVGRWVEVLSRFVRGRPSGEDGQAADLLAARLSDAWDLQPASEPEGSVRFRGGLVVEAPETVDVMLGGLAQEVLLTAPTPLSWLHAVSVGESLPPGPDPTIDVDADGGFELPEIVARRFGASTEPGRIGGTKIPGWHRVRVPAASEARLLASRWVVLYDRDGHVVGAGPLRCELEAGETVIVGAVAASRPFDRFSLTTHPMVPAHTIGPRPSVDRAIEEARSAVRRQTVGADASIAWAKAALDWLQLGTLYRAAWAAIGADQHRLAQAFAQDGEAEMTVALAAMDAVVGTGTIPVETPTGAAPLVPAWWWVDRAVAGDGGWAR